jgi:serine/threonine protein kinase
MARPIRYSMSDPSTHHTFVAPETAKLAPLFPGYDIEILIATGGMGAVYRAVQKSLDRKVAIKILPHEFSNDAAFCAGFEAEAKAMARLNHPNLIGVYDFGEVEGMLFIIMEYVPGKSLFHSSNGTAIDPSEVIRLVTGICHGLAHAHENGILHRDIKPSNILLDLNAQPKIGDFGLARPIETKIQEGEEIFGTPHYTAPEVVNAPQSVDYRADIFSVGVLLHELLTGKLPADDRRTASAISHCDPRFDVIIRRATHPQPEARYTSASEIANELQIIAASAGPRVLRTAATATPANSRAAKRLTPVGKPLVATPSSNAPVVVTVVVGVIIAAIILAYMGSKNTETTPSSGNTPPPPAITPPTPQVSNPPTTPKPKTEAQPQPKPWNPDHSKPAPDDQETTSNHSGTSDESTTEPSDEDDQDVDKTTMVDPEHHGNATPKSAPEEEKISTFDVEGFFARARVLMKDRATPIIAANTAKLTKNLDTFERGAKRFVRRMDRGDDRDDAEEALDDLMATAVEERYHVPEKLPIDLAVVNDLDELHEECIEAQEALDLSLMAELRQLGSLYIVGLEKQIERLDPKIDAEPIELITEEIEKTRDEADYFPNLMLGIEKKDEDVKDIVVPKKPLLE